MMYFNAYHGYNLDRVEKERDRQTETGDKDRETYISFIFILDNYISSKVFLFLYDHPCRRRCQSKIFKMTTFVSFLM